MAITTTDDTSVVIISTLLEEDRRKSCEEIAHEASMSTASVFRIVKRKVAAKWVAHQLSEHRKQLAIGSQKNCCGTTRQNLSSF